MKYIFVFDKTVSTKKDLNIVHGSQILLMQTFRLNFRVLYILVHRSKDRLCSKINDEPFLLV